MQLNPQQLEAVNHDQGPLLIIAGAGSGKTRVLTERIARLLEQKLAYPEEIYAVTFTNKAASEIRDRVMQRLSAAASSETPDRQQFQQLPGLSGQSAIALRDRALKGLGGVKVHNLPWLGTFHSLAVKMLRRDAQHLGLNNNFTIYDADDQLSLVKKVMADLNINTKNFNPRTALGGISAAKNELLTPREYAAVAHGYYQQNVAEIYEAYQAELRKNGCLDFDDLLMYTVALLREVPQVAERYQQQFKYIMVDEYQDTNHAQYTIVKLLSQLHQNICVVGDDDQSIYAWRGATIRNILEFEQDFANSKVIKLEQNYRSTQKILEASHGIVSLIGNRKPKQLWTENDGGDNIKVYNALDERDETFWAVEQIERLLLEGKDANEVAILYRMNAQSRLFEEALLKAGIPYKIVGNVRFYERKEIKDALAYLRVIYNKADELSLLRIINVPSRKIGAKTIDSLIKASLPQNLSVIEYLLQHGQDFTGGVKKFADILSSIHEQANNLNITELIKFILEKSGYMAMLSDDTEDNRQRLNNLQELINVAAKYVELSPQASLQAFLEEVALQENSTAEELKGDSAARRLTDGRVTLMTIHSAKGLEFGHVFVVGLEEGLFPHSRSLLSTAELDEERRLAYVALTRAKRQLFLSYAESRTVFGSRNYSTPSRFLEDIDPKLVDFESYGKTWADSDTGERWSLNSNDSSRDFFGSGRKLRTSYEDSYAQNKSKYTVNVGEKVRHPKFGEGRVISINDDYVIVNFVDYGEKELATEYANLSR